MIRLVGGSFSAGHSSAAFDPIIEMAKAASAPALEEKNTDAEESARSPMETGVKPKPVVASLEISPMPSRKVSSFTPFLLQLRIVW